MDIAVSPRPMEILLVEDDPDDTFLVQEMTSSGVSSVDVSGFSYRMLVGWCRENFSRSVKRLTRAKRLLPRRCSRCNRRVNINVYTQRLMSSQCAKAAGFPVDERQSRWQTFVTGMSRIIAPMSRRTV